RLGQYLTTLNFITLGTAQQYTHVLTSTAFVQQLAEHLNTGTNGLHGVFQTNDFQLFAHFNDATLYTTGHHSTATRNREHVFYRHQERHVDGTLRLRNVGVQRLNQLFNSRGAQLVVVFTVQRHQRRTGNDRGVVAGEVVGRQQLTQLHFYQLQHLVVFFSAYAAAVFCQQVSLVQEHHDKRYTYLT